MLVSWQHIKIINNREAVIRTQTNVFHNDKLSKLDTYPLLYSGRAALLTGFPVKGPCMAIFQGCQVVVGKAQSHS